MAEPTQDAFATLSALLARFEGPLLRYAQRLVGDAETARDVVQDTFVRAMSCDPASLNGLAQAWLFAVCRNRALDVLRKDGRMTLAGELVLDAHPAQTPPPDARLSAGDEVGATLRLVARLPADQQEVVRLKFQAGLSYRDIAAVTGHSVTNVGFLLHTALKTIRERCKSHE